jgi:hypothetical protein
MTRHRIVLALLFILGVAGLSISQDRRSGDFETLEGTWILDINAPPAAPATILTTFARGGTLIGDGNAANPALRSAWHGVWARRSYLEFSSTWLRWNYDAAGNFTGASEFRMDLNVDRGLDSFTGSVDVLTLDRGLVTTATRPGTIRARRYGLKRPAL